MPDLASGPPHGRVLSQGGGDGSNYTKNGYFAHYAPHDGFYIFAFSEFAGATEGSIKSNQIEFTLGGRIYNLIAGAPIVEPGITKIWVRHHANNRLVPSGGPAGFFQTKLHIHQ